MNSLTSAALNEHEWSVQYMAALLPLSNRQKAGRHVITTPYKAYRPTTVTSANIPFLSLHD
jgi:hypothetical protein